MVVANYLRWFEDAYFLFTVRLFDASLSRSQANPKKIYCIDHGLVTSVSSGILVNSGHLFENLVFTALRRFHREVFYYKTKSGHEVDFVIPVPKSPNKLVQACESMAGAKTKKREVTALIRAMAELKTPTATIVTRNDSELIDTKSGQIEVIPAWRFLLEGFPGQE